MTYSIATPSTGRVSVVNPAGSSMSMSPPDGSSVRNLNPDAGFPRRCDSYAMSQPSTKISRISEKQSVSRQELDALLDSTPLATIALVVDGHPVAFPTGFARIGDDIVIHGSTGSPWLRAAAAGAAVSV